MEFEFRQELKRALDDARDFVLCTVVEARGSSPAKPGQKMLVFADGSLTGTVGGGVNEERIRQAAVELLGAGGSRLLRFDMAASESAEDPICGGSFACFLEVLRDRPKLLVFGGGHIGHALCRLAAVLRFRVTVVDERVEFATRERFPEADRIICEPYEKAVGLCDIDTRASVVIVTPGHVKDRVVLERVLGKGASYVGMVGSQRKWTELRQAMIAAGFDAAALAEVRCPIGINLVGQGPEEIALGILGQIVAHSYGKAIVFERKG